MQSIATFTLNPAIDGSCEAQSVRHTHKVRTTANRYDPGGGGINVARVVQRLGGNVRAHYLAGGATGGVLDNLLDRDGIARSRIDIADHTRISHAVFEHATGREYRFVPEGPLVSEAEWQQALVAFAKINADYLVFSGSLPRGVPGDFYVRLMAGRDPQSASRIVLDTSGAALSATLEAGGLFLVKPSQGELEQHLGRVLGDPEEIVAAAQDIVGRGQARHVAVTMGHEGAILVGEAGVYRLPAIPVEARSAVGAGDSFVGAMTLALAQGLPITDAFRRGVAAGTATVLTPGTGLCLPADVERIYGEVPAL
ncbi:1-phosphofructokinase family hexose kinase [Sphingomonas sp. C3-2]|uniref:1-phosphofructokinase family hexose kinase n=1 Tax=Sphingomonas sp. C3-2 TaxID=3062169 RepID=UPI00294B2AAC|nr:1-phosphofructokinase family hexose kinase [Sphingomonas sp. C3-2]WOK36999.1 1-phosphofructokinase family hexose kinase [Sphingomonas sp. C3-2]